MSGYPYLKKPSMEYFETLPDYSPDIRIYSYDIPLFGEFCLSKKFLSCSVCDVVFISSYLNKKTHVPWKIGGQHRRRPRPHRPHHDLLLQRRQGAGLLQELQPRRHVLSRHQGRGKTESTEMAKKVCPRLRELAPRPEAVSHNLQGHTFLPISVLYKQHCN